MKIVNPFCQPKKIIGNQRGQSTVEAVILVAILVGLMTFISGEVRNRGLVSQVVDGPWAYIAGMIEGGVWLPADQVKDYHPSQFGRVRTPLPDDLR